eukprot:gene37531-45581_t
MGNTRTPASVSARWRRVLKGAVTDTVNHNYQQALEGIKEMPDSGEGDDSAEEDDEGDAGVAALSSESPESKQEKKDRRQDMQRAIRRLHKYKPSIKVYRKRRVIRNI